MTRPDLAAAILALPDEEKLELIGELWDAIGDSAPVPEWHKEELDRRAAAADADPSAFVSWPEAKARILGSK